MAICKHGKDSDKELCGACDGERWREAEARGREEYALLRLTCAALTGLLSDGCYNIHSEHEAAAKNAVALARATLSALRSSDAPGKEGA